MKSKALKNIKFSAFLYWIKRPFKQIRRFIEKSYNILVWIPILWKTTYDYDHIFILNIMKKKLQHMEKFFNSDEPIVEDAKETAKQIRYVLEMLDNILDDDYGWNLDKNIKYKKAIEKYGEGQFGSLPVLIEGKEYHEMTMEYPNIPKEQWEEADQEFHEAYKYGEKLEEAEWNEFWDFIRKNMKSWWD